MICCHDDKTEITAGRQSGMSDLDFDLIDTNHMSQVQHYNIQYNTTRDQ